MATDHIDIMIMDSTMYLHGNAKRRGGLGVGRKRMQAFLMAAFISALSQPATTLANQK
jgi:hypothetical protein